MGFSLWQAPIKTRRANKTCTTLFFIMEIVR